MYVLVQDNISSGQDAVLLHMAESYNRMQMKAAAAVVNCKHEWPEAYDQTTCDGCQSANGLVEYDLVLAEATVEHIGDESRPGFMELIKEGDSYTVRYTHEPAPAE